MASEETEKKNNSTETPKESESNIINSGTGGEVNLSFVPDEKHKVSIASDAIQADIERQRKISTESRHKSILVNGDGLRRTSDGDQKIGSPCSENETMRRYTYESIEEQQDARNSWWFDLCTKCRQKETSAGWEPWYWSFLCPYPFCPTYRHVARILSLVIVGLFTWGILFCIIGEDIAPGGQLFDIAILCISAHVGGWCFKMLNLPALVGMLLVGIIFQNLGLIHIHGVYCEFVAILRRFALVIILIRAGLDLDPEAMKRLFFTVLRMALIPWGVELVQVMCLTHFLFGFPWQWSLLLGSIIAAVAPAVVVPCLIRIRNKGYGVSKGIPTLVIAVSGIDDAASVAAFGIIYGLMFHSNSLVFDVLMGPISIVTGILFGIFWGVLVTYVPEMDDPYVVPLRILMLLGGGLMSVLGSEYVGMGGAGPLGCITAAFSSIYVWSEQGWEIEDNPVATAYEIFWMIFEPILFGLTGTQIKINEIDPDVFGIGCAILISGIVVRIFVTILSGTGTSLNMKEKIFVAISWMAKASVQAALGPVALDNTDQAKDPVSYHYANIVLMMCILSIILTAPLGAIIATLSGTKLLKKTTAVSVPEGWRRTHRPSLRDIQVPDEEYTDDDNHFDEEKEKDSRRSSSKNRPSVVITMQP
ncbi:sodium/hydrogen exchanger 9B2-like [Lycorma delicatula]|uniref:sodium/hydrogen exchanger 9B2-like n=1 Tax=Lycorma delicatula TaxID=130591 RepID=UPI003F5132DC